MRLCDDPTAVDPEALDRLRVVETIKEGETVFALGEGEQKRGDLTIFPGGAAEAGLAATLRGLAAARDPGAGPVGRALRRATAAGPHDAGCVAGALTAAMLAGPD